MEQSTTNVWIITAPVQQVYNAFTTAEALETWMAPDDMKATIQDFDLRVGGGYRMVLRYPEGDQEAKGKTGDKEDGYTASYIRLDVPYKIVQSIRFDTTEEQFMGEMIMDVTLQPVAEGTQVTIVFTNIPKGINPADNEAGTASSLQKLQQYVSRSISH